MGGARYLLWKGGVFVKHMLAFPMEGGCVCEAYACVSYGEGCGDACVSTMERTRGK